MNDMLFSITAVVLDCIAVVYTIYLFGKNKELVRNNVYLERCLEDEKHKNFSRQIEKKEIQGKLNLKEQEVQHLREKLKRYESNTQV